jgi:enoyl-CoA hydratase/carnithine racemase
VNLYPNAILKGDAVVTDHVVVSEAARVLRIQMNRPEKKNALTPAMYVVLAEALERADADPTIRVITITGVGDVFTSGNDLKDFLDAKAMGANNPIMRFLSAIADVRKPLIAEVNGLAVGVGVTMLLHCDLVYAAEGAVFQLPFVNLGVVPEAASSLLLPRMMGHQRAAEVLFFGSRFDVQAARQLGLVNGIHPHERLADVVAEKAGALAAKPPQALRLTKELLKGEAYHSEVAARMEEERVLFEQQLGSPEAREAMSAFFEKRAADFSRFS